MKKSKYILYILAVILVAVAFRAGMSVGAASSPKPGSVSDPLITQSYLEQRLSEISKSSYNKVLLTKGKKITLDMGCEVIVYSGSGNIAGEKGLLNLTSGRSFGSGDSITLYSVFFSPDQSSGIVASSDCILYVRGGYNIS